MDKKLLELSLERLKCFEPSEGYYLAFSGGKDSIVIEHLARRAMVKYEAHYHITTLDPPELTKFIKINYPHVLFDRPKSTMWEIMIKKGFPPSRAKRYCCEILKEGGGRRRIVVTGVRREESKQRESRTVFEANINSRTTYREDVFREDLQPSLESKRKIQRLKMRTKHILNPIIDWTEEDVWNYIIYFGLPYPSLYDEEGVNRLGCIGCPLQSSKKRRREFERWPHYRTLYLRAFEKMLINRKYGEWKTADDVMEHYLS